jgi:two-component system, OmpR family, sensor kinase
MAAVLPRGRSLDRASQGNLVFEGERYFYAYRPIGPRGLVVLRSADLGTGVWDDLLRDLALAGLVGVVLAAATSFVLARSIARPIGRVADASRALAEGRTPEPVPPVGSAELAGLARAFNDMAAQLAASRERERAFLLSVSHELKTPLTAIQGYAEGLADGTFEARDAARPVLLEARRLERLVRDLLDLARMNRHEFEVRREPVDLAEVARDAVARHEGAARSFGVALAADAEEAWVEADHDRVLQVASNLVENALRVTPPSGTVTVRARPGVLVVADTGPGLAAEDVEHAFDRFYLYDKHGRDRSVGSGLGLAIVKQLAVAMNGDVSIAATPGEGATFVVELPRATPPPRDAVRASTEAGVRSRA